ncbi:fatty acid-binding protein, liver-like [Aplochiton taeniatus]
MDFNGKWKIYFEDNLEEFLKAMALPDMLIKMSKNVKPVTEIEQDGDHFTVKVQTPLRSHVNLITVGKETEVTALDGRKMKCAARFENGKLICQTEKFIHTREIQGEEMVEV